MPCRRVQQLLPLPALESSQASTPYFFGQGACARRPVQEHAVQEEPKGPGTGGFIIRASCNDLPQAGMQSCPEPPPDELW